MVGSNRIVRAHKIVTPVGNVNLDPEAEKAFRLSIVWNALEAIRAGVKEQTIFGGGSKE
jgi:hypothetical protein